MPRYGEYGVTVAAGIPLPNLALKIIFLPLSIVTHGSAHDAPPIVLIILRR